MALGVSTSVVVANYNGQKKIPLLLEGLLPQIGSERELIIVDDGSTDRSVELISRIFSESRHLKLIEQPNQGRAKARNTGAELALGELLVFVDNDIIVPDGFIDRIEYIHQMESRAWITGSVAQDIAPYEHQDFLLFRQKLDYFPRNLPPNELGLAESDSFTSQQVAMPKSSFEALGGFDSRLIDSEDFELSVRVSAQGINIIHDFRNAVRHADYATFDQFLERQREYIVGRMRAIELIPDLTSKTPTRTRQPYNSWAKRLQRAPFKYNAFWKTFFSGRLRHLIPLTIRHRLFDWVLSSTVLYYWHQEALRKNGK